MRAIAKVMGFPAAAWFDESGDGMPAGPGYEGQDLAGRVEHLFEVIKPPSIGEPYTNAEVSRAALGDLSEEDVEGIRTSAIGDPTVGQVEALAGVFGVEPSYLVDSKEPPTLDAELIEGLRDETTREMIREALRLPERERGIVLGVMRQFGEAR